MSMNESGRAGLARAAAAPRAAPPPFEMLVSAHGTAVLRVCRAMVGVVDADDVWQETFLAALRTYPTAQKVVNWQAWLVTIARNKSLDHLRRTARVPEPMETAGDGPLEGGDVVVHAVEAGETAAAVWAALARLPQRQREAVVYHHLVGLPYAEVAALLGNSEAAARRAASDAMAALRALLGGDGKGHGKD